MSSVYANLISYSNFTGISVLFNDILFTLLWFKGWFGSSCPNINSPVGSWILVVGVSSLGSTYQQMTVLFNVLQQLDKL